MKPVFICGYPGSGTIWLRWQLAALFWPEAEIDFNFVFFRIPNVSIPEEMANHSLLQKNGEKMPGIYLNTPDLENYLPGKTIIIIRSPYDVMWSLWHREKKFNHFKGSYNSYLAERKFGDDYILWLHKILVTIQKTKTPSKKYMLIRYVDLQHEETFISICHFIETNPPSGHQIKEIFKKTSFSNMQMIEKEKGLGIYANKNKGMLIRNGRIEESKLKDLDIVAINLLEQNILRYVEYTKKIKQLL